MPVRKSVPHDGRISVVTVGDVNDPYDCIACCGTHPASSAEVGLLAIYKCEPNKGMNRIFFDCGRMAMARLSEDSHILADAAKRYSCSARDLPARLDKEAASVAELKARLAALSGFVRDAEAERILADITDTGSEVYQYSSDILSTDELLKLGFTVLSNTSDRILVFTHPESHTCLLFSSGSFKCGQFIKAHASEFGGRGGGRDDNARAIFSDAGSMRRFASAVEEML
jgi:alanyl-tRNA synthetase